MRSLLVHSRLLQARILMRLMSYLRQIWNAISPNCLLDSVCDFTFHGLMILIVSPSNYLMVLSLQNLTRPSQQSGGFWGNEFSWCIHITVIFDGKSFKGHPCCFQIISGGFWLIWTRQCFVFCHSLRRNQSIILLLGGCWRGKLGSTESAMADEWECDWEHKGVLCFFENSILVFIHPLWLYWMLHDMVKV